MTQNLLLAVVLAVVSSMLIATSAALQHYAVGEQVEDSPDKERMELREFKELLRTPRWLLGAVSAGAGALLNFTALAMAPVTVVQPIGILAVPWSILIAARMHREPIPWKKWITVAVTLVGASIFVVLAATHASPRTELDPMRIAIACGVVFVSGWVLGMLGARGSRSWRCLFWAFGGAVFYGLESALIRVVTELVRQTDWSSNWLFWMVVAVLAVGSLSAAFMIQQGFVTGPAELVVGSQQATNPIVAVLFGIIVLGEGANITMYASFGMMSGAIMALFGVIFLSTLHHEEDAPPQPEIIPEVL